MKKDTKTLASFVMLLAISSIVRANSIDEFTAATLPWFFVVQNSTPFPKIEIFEPEEEEQKWNSIAEGGMGHTFSCREFTSYVLKAVPKETIEKTRPVDPLQPFKSEVDANNYLRLFYDSKSSQLDFKQYFLEFREFPVDESGQNEVSPSKQDHLEIQSEKDGPVYSEESEEEKGVFMHFDKSEESDEGEDDKKKLVLMGFEKMKFDFISPAF